MHIQLHVQQHDPKPRKEIEGLLAILLHVLGGKVLVVGGSTRGALVRHS